MWKDIPSYSDYIVNELGDVAKKSTGELLKLYPQKNGYVYVWLDRGYGRTATPLHRVVCMAFHGVDGCKKGLYVDHINTNRSDNRACNLRWVTPKENANNPQTIINKRKRYERHNTSMP